MENSDTAAVKDQLRLDVVDPPVSDEILFFGRRSRRSGNTWVVSLLVVLQLVAFVGTMIVNDCPARSGGASECFIGHLGRFSFQPLYENPLLGPSSSTLVKMGAIQRTKAIHQHQIWRFATAPWLHAGFIHLIVNLLSMIFVGIRLEQDYGPCYKYDVKLSVADYQALNTRDTLACEEH